MIQLRPSNARGKADHGWLRGFHSFSFADYYDPDEMGWGPLRVINEDFIQPGTGFGQHGHRDMEIITYLLEGPLQHKDNMGNGTVFHRPEVQRMSAGRGVLHSEFNASDKEPVHLLQIWIEPDVQNIPPEYEQKEFSDADKRGRLALIASPDGAEGSLTIHQDARLYASLLIPATSVTHALAPGRRAYLHVVSGDLSVNDEKLSGGDGAKIADETKLVITAVGEVEFLLFDLP